MARSDDPKIAARFGANLRRARADAGISQEEVSNRAGLHRTAIGLLERGERMPRLNTITKLAGVVEVPLAVLLDGIEWEEGDNLTRGRFRVRAPER